MQSNEGSRKRFGTITFGEDFMYQQIVSRFCERMELAVPGDVVQMDCQAWFSTVPDEYKDDVEIVMEGVQERHAPVFARIGSRKLDGPMPPSAPSVSAHALADFTASLHVMIWTLVAPRACTEPDDISDRLFTADEDLVYQAIVAENNHANAIGVKLRTIAIGTERMKVALHGLKRKNAIAER